MTDITFEIVEADWPETTPPARQAIDKFLASGLDSAEIKGDDDFLHNVRRVGRSAPDYSSKIEFKMRNKRLFIRRTDASS